MNLIIESKVDITDFCEWLVVEHITPYIATHINQKKAQRFDDIINKYIVTLPKRMLFTDDIILASAYNLIVSKEDDNHIIRIDSNAFIPNTNAKFISIAELINYGNLSTQAYPIYTETFNYFADNIDKYFNMYLEEMLE